MGVGYSTTTMIIIFVCNADSIVVYGTKKVETVRGGWVIDTQPLYSAVNLPHNSLYDLLKMRK